MNLTITPRPLSGTVSHVISSKSQAHRLLICAALADAPTTLRNVGLSADVLATLRCLEALGAKISQSADTLTVVPISSVHRNALLDCGESGSTLRFLLPVAAALGAECAFTGQGKLAQRPLSPMYEQLTAHGAALSPQGTFPLRCGGRLTPGAYTVAGNISSQFITGLLLALPLLPGDSTLTVTDRLESAPYVEMTLDALRQFGVLVETTSDGCFIPGSQRFHSPSTLTVEGDWSGASFWLAAGALSPQGVACRSLNPHSRQGDRAIMELLTRFGAEVQESAQGIWVRRRTMRGISIDIADIPDAAPILAVLAAYAQGETILSPIARLRLKESDRVAAILAMLDSLGVQAQAAGDQLIITGRGGVTGGTVDGFHDHRIVLAAAVAATAAEGPVTILGTEAADKSYPGFFAQFAALGGQMKEASVCSFAEKS